MTKLLLRLFVKNDRNPERSAVRFAVGKLAGTMGILCNGILFLGKLVVGFLTGSVSVIADAINNLSDALSSVATFMGFRMAQQPADKDHPFGHARYEYLAGLVVAALILVMGVELIESSVKKILHPGAVDFSAFAVVVMLCSVGVKLWMSVFFHTLGKQIQSMTLCATGVDSRNDVIVSSAVLAGGIIERVSGVKIDGYIGLAVALFILHSGIDIAKKTISPLLGQQADEELVENISRLVLSHDKVLGIHDLLVHDYGPGQCFASVHAELSADENVLDCHDLIDHIECDALAELNVHLVIHFDPVLPNDEEWNQMRRTVEEIVREIDPKLSMHDFRIVKGAKSPRLVFDLVVPYSMNEQCREINGKIDKALRSRGLKYATMIRFDSEE